MPGISELLDSDIENNTNFLDEDSLISSVSDTITAQMKTTVKKPRKRKCVTMPKKPRAKNSVTPGQDGGAQRKARALQVAVDEDEICDIEQPKIQAKAKRSTKSKDMTQTNPKTGKARSSKSVVASLDQEPKEQAPSPVIMRSSFAATKTAKSYPKPVSEGKMKKTSTKPTTRPNRTTEKVISNPEDDEDEDVADVEPPLKRARTDGRTRQEMSHRRTAASASDTERDPMLRRKLGDMTRKYENVDIKYRSLKEVAITEANANLEMFRKECERVKEAQKELVASLKQELAQQAPMVREYDKAKKDAQHHEAECKKLRSAHNDISKSLVAAQSEIKSLQAKLSAVKAAPASAEVKVPASTHKHIAPAAKPTPSANHETAHQQQLKLDLYSDLTGLIIRDVKQTEEGDTYDCIQTGRDGSKLSAASSIKLLLTGHRSAAFQTVDRPGRSQEGESR